MIRYKEAYIAFGHDAASLRAMLSVQGARAVVKECEERLKPQGHAHEPGAGPGDETSHCQYRGHGYNVIVNRELDYVFIEQEAAP